MKPEKGWESARDSYLQQVESGLKAAGHPKPREIIDDVRSHLDQKYAELPADQKTWESFQKIITEMGPTWDYAELLGGKKRRSRKGLFLGLAGFAVLLIAGSLLLLQSKSTDVQGKGGKMLFTGHCHCNFIKYQVQGDIIKCSYCDCKGCQKATATLKAPFVSVLRTAFTLTSGEPSKYDAASGEKCDKFGEWYFCPKCGTQVFWKAHEGNELDLFAGTLDDVKLFQVKE
jgi:hypothetical protein